MTGRNKTRDLQKLLKLTLIITECT